MRPPWGAGRAQRSGQPGRRGRPQHSAPHRHHFPSTPTQHPGRLPPQHGQPNARHHNSAQPPTGTAPSHRPQPLATVAQPAKGKGNQHAGSPPCTPHPFCFVKILNRHPAQSRTAPKGPLQPQLPTGNGASPAPKTQGFFLPKILKSRRQPPNPSAPDRSRRPQPKGPPDPSP